MSWEWRSFMKLDGKTTKEDLFKEESLTFTDKKKLEERTDLYLFFSCFENDKLSNYGIKFRDVQATVGNIYQSNRLELKIRYSRDKEGREIWDKVVSEGLKNQCQLLKITNKASESPLEETKEDDKKLAVYTIYYKNIAKALEEVFFNKKFANSRSEEEYFKKAILELKSCTSVTFYFVPKKRKQSKSVDGLATVEKAFGSCIKLEAQPLEDQISCVPSNICYFRSICIEGEEKLKTEDITKLQKEQLDYKESIVAGYPEFLLQI